MLKAEAWRLRVGEVNTFVYRLQINDITLRQEKSMRRAMYGWKQVVEGFDPQSDKVFFGFDREFKSEEDFHEWGKYFPFQLSEISSTSNRIKPVKLGLQIPKKKKTKKRKAKCRCGHCHRKGHNERTCPKKKKLS